MPTLLNEHVSYDGAAIAIVDSDGATSWIRLAERVNRWVHLLRAHGLDTGDRLACVTGNRRETFEVLLAALHTGVTVVPVNWHLTVTEIGHILSDSGSRVVITEELHVKAVAAAADGTAGPVAGLVLGDREVEGFAAVEPLLAAASPAEPEGQVCGATMLYTSGTTGRPKGVVNNLFVTGAPYARVGRLCDYARSVLGVPRRERMLLDGPWYHSSQLFFALLSLLQGSRLVIRPYFDPAATLKTIDDHRITVTHLVPTQLVRLLRVDALTRQMFSGASLRRVWHGGGPCPPEVKRSMIDWWGPVLVEYYGATEGGVVTLIDSAEWLARPGSVGRAVPPSEVVVVDDGGQSVAAGQTGQVFFRRRTGNRFHYHNAPEKTQAAYLAPDTFTYGEVGHVDEDGYLFLTGRAQDMIVSGGVNVYPAEVEAALLRHPVVRDAAVIGVADDEFGERVVGIVVPETAVDPDDLATHLDAHCRVSLAGFKVPRTYRVVESLPRDETGKLRKDALRSKFGWLSGAAMTVPRPATGQPTAHRPDIAHPTTYVSGVPHDEFARRRRDEPVGWVAEPVLTRHTAAGRTATRGSGFWAVTRYEDVVAASRRVTDFSSAAKGAFLTDPRTPADLQQARQLLVNMDDPHHARLRKLVTSVFTPRAVRGLLASIDAHAAALVAKVVAAGEFDVVTDLAAELPLLVLADLLGVPKQDRALLYGWSNHLVGFDDPDFGGGDIDAYRTAMAEAFQYALNLGVERRARPTDDLVSLLANAEVDGTRLTDREFCNFWLLLVVAGNETTRHLVAGTMQALTEHPGECARLVEGRVPMESAVEELLRWVTPIMQFRRTATRDTEIGGQAVTAGEKVVLYYTSANRDATVFAEPERLDLGRTPNRQLSFGIGPHYCLGAHLARAELTALLRVMSPHLGSLQLTGPVSRLASNFVNGVKAMPAVIGSR
ncbi:cytochrome P450 [Salinispora arenicola]|uniref:cytochrome P450 n=1 Tax=Salinispora arenicola TaxID=168697 RepID=UPI0003759595|nr:cytochrome P450 [Salinispora arenicola]